MTLLALLTVAVAVFVDSRESTPTRFGAEPPEGWEEAWLKLSRPLKDHEIEAAREVLGDTIPYHLVRVVESDGMPAAGHAGSRMNQRYFVVRVNPRMLADRANLEHLGGAAFRSPRHALLHTLVHELAHVGQMLEMVPGGTYSDVMRRYSEQLYTELSKREAIDRYNWGGRVKLQVPWLRWPWEARAEFIAALWEAGRRHPGTVLGSEYAPYLAHVPVVPLGTASVTTTPGWAIQDLEALARPQLHLSGGEVIPDPHDHEAQFPEGAPEGLLRHRPMMGW